MLIFIIFIFSALLLGSFHIGGISIRVMSTVIMVLHLIIGNRHNTLPLYLKKRPIYIYLLFLLITFLSKALSEINSTVDETSYFFIQLISLFFVCIIAYLSIDKIIVNKKNVLIVLSFLVAICFINDVATFLQYNGNPMGLALGYLFSTSEGEYLREVTTNLERYGVVHMAMPGIFGHGAINGYMTSSLSVLSLYYLVGEGKKYWKVGLILYLVSLVGVFCCQERSALGLTLLFSIYTFWKYSPKVFKLALPLFVILLCAFSYDYFIDFMSSSDNVGRYAKFTEFGSDRENLTANAIEFIQNNFLLGGEALYERDFGVTPHNFFLHAIIYSGLLGALIIIWLFIYLLYDAFRIISKSQYGQPSYFFAVGLSIYLLNGIFHSSSLITGDVLIWLLYGLMLRSKQLGKI